MKAEKILMTFQNRIISEKGKSDCRSEEGTLAPAHKRCSRSGLTSGRIRHKNLKWQIKKIGKFMGKSILGKRMKSL